MTCQFCELDKAESEFTELRKPGRELCDPCGETFVLQHFLDELDRDPVAFDEYHQSMLAQLV